MGAVEYVVMLLAFTGVVLLLVLCAKIPRLHRSGRSATLIPKAAENYAKVSVIIPTHNASHELPALLANLHNQSLEPVDIICVDLQSADDTAVIAQRLGATVLPFSGQATDPSRGQTMMAYQQGVRQAKGEYFLFLQPNLRMAPETIASFVSAYRKSGKPLSLRPYHMIRRPYENLALFVYSFGAFSKGIGLPGRHQDKDFSFFDEALVFSRYHWELFTSEDSRPLAMLPQADDVPLKVYDAECTALQVAVAMPSHENTFRKAVMAHKSPSYYDGISKEDGTFSTTAAAGYAVDAEDLFEGACAEDISSVQYDDSYDWMCARFAQQQMGLRVMLGAKLLRCRNYPNGFQRFMSSMVKQTAKDRQTSVPQMRFFVVCCLLCLLLGLFSIVYGIVDYYPLLTLFGILDYLTVALILYSKNKLIGNYHPLMFMFYPLPLMFYICCDIGSLFIRGKNNKISMGKKANAT